MFELIWLFCIHSEKRQRQPIAPTSNQLISIWSAEFHEAAMVFGMGYDDICRITDFTEHSRLSFEREIRLRGFSRVEAD